MKYAVIADIHANLEAFEVVLADAREQKCTHRVRLARRSGDRGVERAGLRDGFHEGDPARGACEVSVAADTSR